MSNRSDSQMFLIHQKTNELSLCISSCPVKDMRPMWCSQDMKNSCCLDNFTKTLFSEKLFSIFAKTEYKAREILFYLEFFLVNLYRWKMGSSIPLLLDYAKSAG